MISCDTPVWEPLEKVVSQEKMGVFMYMYSTTDQEPTVHAYKHHDTRRYLFIDDTGQCYRYLGDNGYRPLATEKALEHAFS